LQKQEVPGKQPKSEKGEFRAKTSSYGPGSGILTKEVVPGRYAMFGLATHSYTTRKPAQRSPAIINNEI
jgi:hypothetical protein